MDIAPGLASRSPQCVGCGQCVEACPRPGTLSMRLFTRPVSRFTVLMGSAGLFSAMCLTAMALGYWDSSLPAAMLRSLYAQVMR